MQGHTDSKSTLRGGYKEGEERRSTTSVGLYSSESIQNNQSNYNRYTNQYTSYIASSNTNIKAKGNNSMIQRQLKNRVVKNIWINSQHKDKFIA